MNNHIVRESIYSNSIQLEENENCVSKERIQNLLNHYLGDNYKVVNCPVLDFYNTEDTLTLLIDTNKLNKFYLVYFVNAISCDEIDHYEISDDQSLFNFSWF